MDPSTKLGFIGGGNMARAIVQGILNKGVIKSSNVTISSPSQKTLESWKPLSVQTTLINAEVINQCDIIIFAFKPHQLDAALKNIKEELNYPLTSKLFVSILAGVSTTVIYDRLVTSTKVTGPNQEFTGRLIRVLPNTPALVGEGFTAISPHSSATENDIKNVKLIFESLGGCEIVPEYLLSAVTGVSGSGPAYIYMVIEALSDGGVKQGLPRSLANTLAAQTVFGAAKMVIETKKHTAQLKDEVCSAGGTTIHAVHALEKGGLRATLMNAVEAAATRSEEISKQY